MKIGFFLLDLYKNKKSIEKLMKIVIEKKIDEEPEETFKIDFNKLISINEDTIGWIKFNKEKVNNPIVHTNDNAFYLKHSFEKKYNQAGTIFMDYRNTSFDNKNVVLFGHSMPDNTMFGSLQDVFQKDFFNDKENNYIQIFNKENELLTYKIFSYYIIEKEEYYITTFFENENKFKEFIDTITKRSYKNFNIEVFPSDKILTLSTCQGASGTSKRKVIHAKRVMNNIS